MKKEKIFILVFCAAVFISLVIPVLDKTLFVSPDGHWNTLDPLAAFLISIGVYYGWKIMRIIFMCLFGVILFCESLLTLNTESEFFMNFLLMLIVHAGLLVVFIKSRIIRNNFSHT